MNESKLALWSLCLCAIFALVSCEKLEIPSNLVDTEDETEKTVVTITTRGAGSDNVRYPVKVYAFGSDGNCKAQQIVNSASDALEMTLNQGSYTIVAVGSSTGYDVPQTPTLSSFVTCSGNNNYSTSPLQMGQAEITLSKSSANVNIMMTNCSAQLSIELGNVPSNVTAITASISGQHSKVSLSGQGDASTATSSVVTLQKNNSKWQSGTFYTLASAPSTTSVSISMTTSSGTSTYGYTYSQGLLAGTPYNLTGTYVEGSLSMTGTITAQGWAQPINLSFDFGPGANNSGGTSGEPSTNDFPEPGTIYKGFFVVGLSNVTSTTATAMLMSLKDWSNMISAKNSEYDDDAQTIANGYSEGVVNQWMIPDSDDAAVLKELFTQKSITALNAVITAAGGDAVDGEARYLCDEALKTFGFTSGSISYGGTTKSDYHLRLVTWVNIQKE